MRATLAVILAGGLGTRLRADDGTALDARQAAAAAAGAKGLVPLGGRPLLDFVLHELAEGGVRDVVLVVPPGDSPLRERYDREHPPQRLRLRFAVQEEPRGTAHALLAAREAVCAALGAPSDTGGRRHFLMCNADNLYTAAAVESLVDARGPGVIAYDAETLVRDSGIEVDRVARFALLDIADDDTLRDVVEKPERGHPLFKAEPRRVSMNLWRFRDSIFDACAAIPPSPRGEFELADAVRETIRRGERFAVHRRAEAVFDLTHRRDVAALEARLAGRVPRP